jgi:transposase InsO family protein
MKNRSELFSIFQIFRNMIKTQFAHKIRILHSDNAKEYMSHSFASYLSNKGIIHQTSCAHTPQQNGVAERKNRHLLDVARCLLSQMHVPKQFWTEAVLTACYLINRMPSSVLEGASPHSLLYPSSSPFSLPLKVFGCVCYVHNLGPGFDKLDLRATKCVFLGYSTTQKGYRCYSPVLRRYFTCADVTFDESLSYFPATTSLSDSSLASDAASLPLPVPLPLPPHLHAPLQAYQRRP